MVLRLPAAARPHAAHPLRVCLCGASSPRRSVTQSRVLYAEKESGSSSSSKKRDTGDDSPSKASTAYDPKLREMFSAQRTAQSDRVGGATRPEVVHPPRDDSAAGHESAVKADAELGAGSEMRQSLVSSTAEDLLKQRFLHAQKRSSESSLAIGGSGSPSEVPGIFRTQRKKGDKDEDTSMIAQSRKAADDAKRQQGGDASDAGKRPRGQRRGKNAGDAAPPTDGGEEAAGRAELPDGLEDNFVPPPPFDEGGLLRDARHPHPSLYEQPFDTHLFVKRLDQGGWVSDKPQQGKRDPAQAIMELTRSLLQQRAEEVTSVNMDRGDLDNQLYLFSAALSELRTEVRVRARNDAAALRSLTTLLQHEVDGLSQKMQADIERLKHDIQVDMNHRKTETKEEQNNLEQEIQDLNNRFTIFLSDLKTEIEQSIKWDATRRALSLVFGIVAILVCTLALADYLSREQQAQKQVTSAATSKKDAAPQAAPARTKPAPGAGAPALRNGRPRPADAARVPPEHAPPDEGEPPPQSAEEWGLLPRYEADEVRYV